MPNIEKSSAPPGAITGEPATRQPLSSQPSSTGVPVPSVLPDDFLTPARNPELVFALVGPIGTNMDLVSSVLTDELRKVNYKTEHIKITGLLAEFVDDFKVVSTPLEARYESLIDAGNTLRQKMGRADALALLAVAAIRRQRAVRSGDRSKPVPATAYVLSQFKRPEEIDTLRRVYGASFVQISAYSSSNVRTYALTSRIAASHYREKPDEWYKGRACDLMARDASEEENRYGQRLRDTFPLADVVIDANDAAGCRRSLSRFIRAFFGDNFVTPTTEEYGMFLARSAALRSSDLSRQVGAAALYPSGEVISLGCNEVPRSGGGTYWEGDPFDRRDFVVGFDSSVKMKQELLEDIFRRLKAAQWLSVELDKMDVGQIASRSLDEGGPASLKRSGLMSILEFGRIVHAEMGAISDAARLGLSLIHKELYCTTFPCHICARHIVAAGLQRVVYMEPYSKSAAAELYPDSIEIEGGSRLPGPKVKFDQFLGIGPQRYSDIFGKGKRKTDGGDAEL